MTPRTGEGSEVSVRHFYCTNPDCDDGPWTDSHEAMLHVSKSDDDECAYTGRRGTVDRSGGAHSTLPPGAYQ